MPARVAKSKSSATAAQKPKIKVTKYQRENLNRVFDFAVANEYSEENWKEIAKDHHTVRRLKLEVLTGIRRPHKNDNEKFDRNPGKVSYGLNFLREKMFGLKRITLTRKDKERAARQKEEHEKRNKRKAERDAKKRRKRLRLCVGGGTDVDSDRIPSSGKSKRARKARKSTAEEGLLANCGADADDFESRFEAARAEIRRKAAAVSEEEDSDQEDENTLFNLNGSMLEAAINKLHGALGGAPAPPSFPDPPSPEVEKAEEEEEEESSEEDGDEAKPTLEEDEESAKPAEPTEAVQPPAVESPEVSPIGSPGKPAAMEVERPALSDKPTKEKAQQRFSPVANSTLPSGSCAVSGKPSALGAEAGGADSNDEAKTKPPAKSQQPVSKPVPPLQKRSRISSSDLKLSRFFSLNPATDLSPSTSAFR